MKDPSVETWKRAASGVALDRTQCSESNGSETLLLIAPLCSGRFSNHETHEIHEKMQLTAPGVSLQFFRAFRAFLGYLDTTQFKARFVRAELSESGQNSRAGRAEIRWLSDS